MSARFADTVGVSTRSKRFTNRNLITRYIDRFPLDLSVHVHERSTSRSVNTISNIASAVGDMSTKKNLSDSKSGEVSESGVGTSTRSCVKRSAQCDTFNALKIPKVDLSDTDAVNAIEPVRFTPKLISAAFDDVESRLDRDLQQLESESSNYERESRKLIKDRDSCVSRLNEETVRLKNAVEQCEHFVESNKIARENCTVNIRKLKQKKCYYEYCRRLTCATPNASGLWQFTDAECPVCMEQYKKMIKIDGCQHLLCLDCARSIYGSNTPQCPLCRYTIIGYETFDEQALNTEHVSNLQHRTKYPDDPIGGILDSANSRTDAAVFDVRRFSDSMMFPDSVINGYRNNVQRMREANDIISETIRNVLR